MLPPGDPVVLSVKHPTAQRQEGYRCRTGRGGTSPGPCPGSTPAGGELSIARSSSAVFGRSIVKWRSPREPGGGGGAPAHPRVQTDVVMVPGNGYHSHPEGWGEPHVAEPDHLCVEVHGLRNVSHIQVYVADPCLRRDRGVQRVAGVQPAKERIQVQRVTPVAGPAVRPPGKGSPSAMPMAPSSGDSAYSSMSWPSGSLRYVVFVITWSVG